MTTKPKMTFHKSAVNQPKLKLYGKRWNDRDWDAPSFEIGLADNNPRITVFPKNPREKGKTAPNGKPLENMPIIGAMDIVKFYMFVLTFKKALRSNGPKTYTATIYGQKYDDNGDEVKGSTEPKAKITYGKDANGKFTIVVKAKDREECVFEFGDTRWMSMEEDGEPMNDRDFESLNAMAYITAIEELMANDVSKVFKPVDPKNFRRNNNQNNATPTTTPTLTGDVGDDLNPSEW